jgi:hypothetical protein
MTQPIENTRQKPSELMAPGSRYINQNVIYYGEKRIITFDTYIKEKYTIKGNEKVILITKGTEYRPDLVSYDFYGFVDNWWRILEANNMKDIWDFKSGKTVLLPDKVI